MMAGLPIAVSNFPEMRKIAIDDELGETFDPENIDSIISALKSLLEPEKYARMKENILAKRDNYSWSIEEKKLISIYLEI